MQRGPAATRLLEATRIREGTIQYRREHLQINQVRRRDTIIARPHKATERAFYDLSDKVLVAVSVVGVLATTRIASLSGTR